MKATENIDLDQLAADFEQQSEEASGLAEKIRNVPVPAAAESDDLIKSVAANLATINDAAGLPHKDAAHFEEQIRMKQRSS